MGGYFLDGEGFVRPKQAEKIDSSYLASNRKENYLETKQLRLQLPMKKLITREKRGYIFAAICSAAAAMMMFYKLMLNDLYLKILNYPWMAFVLACLIVGNMVHGFFAFRSFQSLHERSSLDELINTKITFYKSLIINFLLPYLFLIILFVVIGEYAIAIIALMLFILMSMVCYTFDLKPILNLKKEV